MNREWVTKLFNNYGKSIFILYFVSAGCQNSFSTERSDSSPTLFSAPTGVYAAPSNEKGTIIVHWDTVNEVNTYHVYTTIAPGVEKSKFKNKRKSFNSPYRVSGLTSGKTYYFTVTAGNGPQESSMSLEVSATAP